MSPISVVMADNAPLYDPWHVAKTSRDRPVQESGIAIIGEFSSGHSFPMVTTPLGRALVSSKLIYAKQDVENNLDRCVWFSGIGTERSYTSLYNDAFPTANHVPWERTYAKGLVYLPQNNSKAETNISGNQDHPAWLAFKNGINGIEPGHEVVLLARRLSMVAAKHVDNADIRFDSDGELSFDLRLRSGRLLMAELSVAGAVFGSLYDRNDNFIGKITTEDEFIAELRK